LFETLLNVRHTASDAIPFLKYCATNMDKARAQLFQDLLVLFLLEEKRDGYFIEFGAMDGIRLSNTFLPRKQVWLARDRRRTSPLLAPRVDAKSHVLARLQMRLVKIWRDAAIQ
jgi:hypothetical protein